MLRIRIRTRMFLGLPDSLVRDTALDPDPLSSRKNSEKNLDSFCFVTLWLFFFEKWCKCSLKSKKQKPRKTKIVTILKVADKNRQIQSWIRMHLSEVRIRGSGSVPTNLPNVTDPQHCFLPRHITAKACLSFFNMTESVVDDGSSFLYNKWKMYCTFPDSFA
jgi:hypothetical protein